MSNLPNENNGNVDGSGGESMRLNFSAMDETQIAEGIARLGQVIREALDLHASLGDLG